ncbi:hypothetical protein IWQ60_002191 [Tieghemiomyces parasiticus]|uniref:Uncharacterized protein n=1 Tax=Tieghemiomyces parasiticus TaxID=78921 RepID=A0A9W8AJF2_9FUNG|nr:hypothetical protein IWQ60_002191 [Tieghemiomyces parasiticus]
MPRYLSRAGTGIDVFQNELSRFVSIDDRDTQVRANSSVSGRSHAHRRHRRRLVRRRNPTATGFLASYLSEEQSHAPHNPHRRLSDSHVAYHSAPGPTAGHVWSETDDDAEVHGREQHRFRRPSRLRRRHRSSDSAKGNGHPFPHLLYSPQTPLLDDGGASQRPLSYGTSLPADPPVPSSDHFPAKPTEPTAAAKLGTFEGVFLPVCSSIWGIILFVRVGFAVGQAGILGTVGIFLLSYFVTLLASLSVSAISSNGVVKSGGPYYMISRCLGPEFGGSVGVVFAFGTLLSGVLSAIAFAEPLVATFGVTNGSLLRALPVGYWYELGYNSISLFLCIVVCLLGVQLFAKANTVLTGIVFTATLSTLLSFVFKAPFIDPAGPVEFTGFSWRTFQDNLWPRYDVPVPGMPLEDHFSMFALLFPACIGIMAGASMSGDLRNPGRSIPRGTLGGMALTCSVYLLLVIGLGCTTSRDTLLRNYNVLQDISVFPPMVALGALSTAFTSTLTCIILASKILQAIGRDHIVPGFDYFAYGTPATDEPTVSSLFSYAVCQLALFAGDINAVAPYVTMFYLLTFTILNLACCLLKVSSAPNFRPSFRYFKAWTALLGVVVSFGLMLVVNPLAACVSLFLAYLLFIVIHYTAPPKAWGDVTQSLIYHQVRKYLLRLDMRKEHVKFWRPQILLLVHNPRRMYHLIKFCNSLKKGGLFILGHILKGDFHAHLPELRRQQQAWLRFVDVTDIKAFVDLTISDCERTGARNLIMASGLGGMRPNLVVMGLYNLSGYRYRLRFQREEDSADSAAFSEDSYDPRLDDTDLPTDQIELETSMSVQDYVCIIEDLLMVRKAVALAYGFTRLHRTCPPPCRSWWPPFAAHERKKYIDLWPIQMSLEHPYSAGPGAGSPTDETGTTVPGAGQRVFTTNFDSYALVLQLGTILHMVPYWRDHFILRVMCFVERAEDVAEEFARVRSLLTTLRIRAELHVLHLDCGQVATYDLIVQGDSTHVEVEALSQLHRVLDQSHLRTASTDPPSMQRPPDTNQAPTVVWKTDAAAAGRDNKAAEGPEQPLTSHAALPTALAGTGRPISRRATVADIQRHAGPDALLSTSMKVNLTVPHAVGPMLGGESSTSSEDYSEVSSVSSDEETGAGCKVAYGQPRPESSGLSGPPPRDATPEPSHVQIDVPDPDSARGTRSPHVSFAPAAAPGTTAADLGPCLLNGHRSTSDLPSSSGIATPNSRTTGRRLEFNELTSRAQNIILNNLIQLHSSDTAVLLTTLPTPDKGTYLSEERSVRYVEDIELLVNGLPPTMLVHAASLTVTTAL